MYKRMIALGCIFLFSFSILYMRIFWIVSNPTYQAAGQAQGTYTLTAGHTFGNIYDRSYNLLVNDTSTYYAVINPTSEAAEEILREIGAPELRGMLRLPGYIPNGDLPAVYNGASAFLYTSLRESFGIPQLEAMACGTPVVTSAASAIPEAILVDPTDPTAIADALLRLETDAEFRAGQVAYGLERVKQFSWEKTARHLLALYESLGKTN